MAAPRINVGRTIGPYRIERKLGTGGMGTVYLARTAQGERVAVKILHRHLYRETVLVERFRREAEAGVRLQHPAIVRTLGTGETADGYHYFAMEYFRGRTVEEILRRHGRHSELQALVIGYRVASALEHAHRKGIFHRDIKPANMMINRTGAVRVADFGLALVLGDSKLTQTGTFMGTPAYCPPEQLRGEEMDGRVDIYALGVTLYEMLTGRAPYEGRTPFEVMERALRDEVKPIAYWRDDVSADTIALIEHMMHRDRDKRPTFATETVDRIEDLLSSRLRESGTAAGFETALRKEAQRIFMGTIEVDTADPNDAPTTAPQNMDETQPEDEDDVPAITIDTRPDEVVQLEEEGVAPGDAPRVVEEPMEVAGADFPVRVSTDVPDYDWRGAAAERRARRLAIGALAALLVLGWLLKIHVRAGVPILARLMAIEHRIPVQVARRGVRLLGPDTVPGIAAALEGAEGKQRQRLFAALRELETPRAGDILFGGINDADPVVRMHAVAGLAALDHPRSRDACVWALQDADTRVRAAGLSGLTDVRSPELLPLLAAAYIGADSELRQDLTRAVIPYGDAALPHLRTVWDRLDQNGKRELVVATERIATPAAQQLLIDWLAEPEVAVRFFAVEALHSLTGQDIGDDPAAWRAWAATYLGARR